MMSQAKSMGGTLHLNRAGDNRLFRPSNQVALMAACPTLTIAAGCPVGIALIERMPVLAMRFIPRVRRHCQTLKEDFSLRRKSITKAHATFRPGDDRVCFESSQFSQVRGFVRDAFNFQYAGISPIEHLFASSRPTTVLFRVPEIVVDAIKRIAARTLAHVINKCGKALCPSLTDGNAPTAVIAEGRISFASAAREHLHPSAIQRVLSFHLHGSGLYMLPLNM